MDKIERIFEMQHILSSISDTMVRLGEDLGLITSCIQKKCIISSDISDRVIASLSGLHSLSDEFRSMCMESELEGMWSQQIEVLQANLEQAVKQYEMDKKLVKYKRFLLLHTEDEGTKALLEAKKADLQKLLDDYTEDKELELEPYNKFIEAILEKEPARMASFMVELSQEFGYQLLGKAIFEKTICVSGDEVLEKEDKAAKVSEKDLETDCSGVKTEPVIERVKSDIAGEAGKNEEVHDGIDENVTKVTPEDEVTRYGFLITKEVFDKAFHTWSSEAESKKVGAKIFVNDIKAKFARNNARVVVCVDQYNSVTPEFVAVTADISVEEAQNALNYLQSKGYVRKYSVEGIGLFFCVSPRGTKALQAKEVRTFLKIKGHAVKEESEVLKDALHPVLARIAYAKLLAGYAKQLGEGSTKVSYSLWNECFSFRITNNRKEKAYVITGAFWEKDDELDQYIHHLGDKYLDPYEHFMVAAINQTMAKELARYLIEKLNLRAEKVYCYSLEEDTYIKYDSDELVQIADTEKAKTGEIETEAEEIEETKEPALQVNPDEVLTNAYQMIAHGKMYCATTYLRSMMDDSDRIRQTFEKLAYAVNAPWMRCSYNSQKIFSLYSTGADVFSKYAMVAASLRNFFMNHASYDYSMKALHANIKEVFIVSESVALTNVIYNLVLFKENVHKGADFYAAYRAKDQMAVNKKLVVLVREAKAYYDSYILGQPKNHKHVRRFIDTWKLIFSNDGEIAEYLKAIIDGEYDLAEFLKDYLTENFIGSDSTPDYSNIDMGRLNRFIDGYWNKANRNNGNQYKTTGLMSDLRNNLINAIEKILKVMCEWLTLVEETENLKDDEGIRRYREMNKELLSDLSESISDIDKKGSSLSVEEAAGNTVLKSTLQELVSRVDGSYDERMQKYYYIDFLRGKDILLDEEYLPDMRGKFVDFAELSLSNRILRHSQAELMTFEEKLNDIFNNYGDDYGTAELIVSYLEDMGDFSCSEKYNIKKSEELAQVEAKYKLDGFIENLELAQSYGQIEETRENKKEKIQKIANEWFEYAKESRNYGFFNIVLDQYEKKIHEDAKVRGRALLRELDTFKAQGIMDDRKQNKILKIQEMIASQNYTVAEDLLSRMNSSESDEEIEVAGTDYLQKFIDEYDYNYKIVANSSRKLSDLVSSRMRNKDERGARRLVDNWMSNGQPLGCSRLGGLLDALGFTGAEVLEQPKIGKIENYLAAIRESHGRKVNYKHPIAAFGSKAGEEGFRVVCLFGKYDADRLIEECKNIAGSKNTFVLLDYALSLLDRRKLARKMKSDLGDKVFAVLDRVLLMFLVNNYSVQFINQILMSVMMPFSYYQPYVWDSSKVMPPEIFMGRKDELEKIESPAGVNIVYGGRQLGKSALLKMAKMNIDNDENHDRAVYIEIKGLDYERAAKKIGHELFDAGVLDKDIDTMDWDDLARAIKQRLQNSKLSYIPYLLLLLDEADTFIESCEKINFQPFDALKEIQSVGMDRFKFVIAGLHNIVRFKTDAALSNNSVLTHLTSITIKPFDKREARQLLEEPLHYLGLRFPEDKQSLVSLILANTNYFPGLIQLYCANLIEAMRKNDYAGYRQVNTPAYEVNPNHIKKVLSDADFMNQIREKFEITLKLDEDNMYFIIALLMAYLYHQNANSAAESEGFSAVDIIHAAKEYGVKKVAKQSEAIVSGLMQELLELNILRQTVQDLYLFSRYSFFQMMGTAAEVEDKLLGYMED